MDFKGKNCLICNCEKTMLLNEKALAKALDNDDLKIHSHLCRSQLSSFEKALEGDETLLVACTQEAALFSEIAQEHGKDDAVSFINIRENAGWSKDAKKAVPKITALLQTQSYQAKPTRLKSTTSDGMCLIYGKGQAALEAAQLLSAKLSVTLMLSEKDDLILPQNNDVPIYRGKIKNLEGSFGGFSLTVDKYAPLMPSSKDHLNFVMERDGAKSQCSIILDLSGNAPLVTGHTKRDGYKWVEPGDRAAILHAVIELSEMVGEFEKPIYVNYEAESCAHARSQKTGCSNCLDVCPAGAITENGDLVAISNDICGGCGSCHSVCPTGSIAYQYPTQADTIGKCQDMLMYYKSAGGKNPVILMHDGQFGTEILNLLARYGKGLPANVIPQSLHSTAIIGHVEIASLIASGAHQIIVLANPKDAEEHEGMQREINLANAILSGLDLGDDRAIFSSPNDTDQLEEILWDLSPYKALKTESFAAVGKKRDIARLAFGKLFSLSKIKSDVIELPEQAPYGVVEIEQTACTLCMACTSACPASAIIDTPEEPKLRFVESACVQCGLCVKTCPEKALDLKPQLNFSPTAAQPIILHEEEPFNCIVCDTPFATKSTIERITGQLAQKHSMFASAERADLIKMCQDCRVEAQANSSQDPFAHNSRPSVRTTEDYIEAEKKGLSSSDFLIDD